MARPTSSTPTSGPYNVPTGSNMIGGSKYSKVVLASATFIATGSNGGVMAVSSAGGCTVTLVGGGSLVIPATAVQPEIYEVSVSQVTAGSAYLYYR